MRPHRFGVLIAALCVIAAVIYQYRTQKTSSNDSKHASQVKADSAAPDQAHRSTDRIDSALAQYQSEGISWPRKCQIANELASSHANLWEACARKIKHAGISEHLALAHFTSAYFKRGPQQQDELRALLRSSDADLVAGLLYLLSDAVDLGPNDEWQLHNALGGSDMTPHIARTVRVHHHLAPLVAMTLSTYGSSAKSEIPTLLRLALSRGELDCFQAKVALLKIDPQGVYLQFRLDPLDAPLTAMQRTEIEAYLQERAG